MRCVSIEWMAPRCHVSCTHGCMLLHACSTNERRVPNIGTVVRKGKSSVSSQVIYLIGDHTTLSTIRQESGRRGGEPNAC